MATAGEVRELYGEARYGPTRGGLERALADLVPGVVEATLVSEEGWDVTFELRIEPGWRHWPVIGWLSWRFSTVPAAVVVTDAFRAACIFCRFRRV